MQAAWQGVGQVVRRHPLPNRRRCVDLPHAAVLILAMAYALAILAVVAMVFSVALIPRAAAAAESAKMMSKLASVSGPLVIKMTDASAKLAPCDRLIVTAVDNSGNVLVKSPAESDGASSCRYSLRVPADTSFTLIVSGSPGGSERKAGGDQIKLAPQSAALRKYNYIKMQDGTSKTVPLSVQL